MAKTTGRTKRQARDTEATKHKGVSLHIGLNRVDRKHYAGWNGELRSAETDANAMSATAARAGMQPQLLLSENATRAKVLSSIRAAAKGLASGDMFFLTFSGMGGQMPDQSSGEEPDQDQTWCLYDAQLIDDEITLELSRFLPDVRILVLSDSCHSGTVTRAVPSAMAPSSDEFLETRLKLMPVPVTLATYREHQVFYDRLQMDVSRAFRKLRPGVTRAEVASDFRSAVIMVTGCQDNQIAIEGPGGGLFTHHVLTAYDEGRFRGSYARLFSQVKAAMPPTQTPNIVTFGKAHQFLKETPFTI